MIRVIELFSGIGAQRMALTLEKIPHKVVAISEIDPHALASYEAIWGDCPNLGDITNIDRLPPADLVTYSFPCQDLSIAGKRKGMGPGTRSGLVWEVIRLLKAYEESERPEWLLMENVPLVVSSPLWPDLLKNLQDLGYFNSWDTLDSSDYGSPQKRIRTFMVSRLHVPPYDFPEKKEGPRKCIRDIMEPNCPKEYIRRIPFNDVVWRKDHISGSTPIAADSTRGFYSRKSLYSPDLLAPTVTAYHGGNFRIKVIADWDNPHTIEQMRRLYSLDGLCPVIMSNGDSTNRVKVVVDADNCLICRDLSPLECWRLMGFPDWAYNKASTVSSRAQLYTQVGNSIVVEVLRAIFSSIFVSPRKVQRTLEEAWA